MFQIFATIAAFATGKLSKVLGNNIKNPLVLADGVDEAVQYYGSSSSSCGIPYIEQGQGFQKRGLKRNFDSRIREDEKETEKLKKIFDRIPKKKRLMKTRNSVKEAGVSVQFQTMGGIDKINQKQSFDIKNMKKPVWFGPSAPNIPKEFKHRITEMAGSNVVLVIQKKLFKTDVNSGQSRLSIPHKQIKSEFLTAEEKRKLDKQEGICVELIEPCLRESIIWLKKWKIKTSYSYTLITNWNSVVKRNRLEEGDIVQLYAFRVMSILCFLLVKFKTGGEGEARDSSTLSERRPRREIQKPARYND